MDRKNIIETMLLKGFTLDQIGRKLGVSKQRIYQLCTKYRLETPERRRKGYWDNKNEKEMWLWKILGNKVPNLIKRDTLFDELWENFPERCPILDLELDFSEKGKRNDSSPSIDKIIPEKGYVPGNVAIISWRANRIKNNGTADEHQKIANWIYKNHLAG